MLLMLSLTHEVKLMAKMTKAQARKRLSESKNKLLAVYVADYLTTDQFVKLEAILNRAMNKLK